MATEPIVTDSAQDSAKLAAGRYAVDKYCFDGAKLGLGSGTTSAYFVRALAEKVADGLNVVGVPTSTYTEALAQRLGIELVSLNDIDQLDVCIDGPDQIDRDGTMIKGGGSFLLREKLVATNSAKEVIIADSSKAVETLGAFPLPIEIVKYASEATTRQVRRLLAEHGYPEDLPITKRMRGDEVLTTDNGNVIIDVHLGSARDAAELTVQLNEIPGVVENGFFVGVADRVVFGWPDGTAVDLGFPFELPLAKPAATETEER